MRQFRRPSISLPTLAAEGPGGKKRAAQITDFHEKQIVPKRFPEHWTEPDVRGALYGMQGRVCAYCGADIDEAGIDVEHFRPKGGLKDDAEHQGYWWLAYEFSNYVLSCVICNQKLKRNRFPVRAGTQRIRYATRDNIAEEQRVLFDPTIDPVEEWLSFEWQTPAGRIVPNPALPPEQAQRVNEVLRFFRINFKAPQRKKRLDIQRSVLEKVSENKAEEASEFAVRYRSHSLVAREILQAKAPGALPTSQQELEWLLNKLTAELLTKLEDLNDPHHSQLDETEAMELLWALAVLWKDPLGATADFVEDFLARRGLRDKVSEFVAKL